MYLNLSYWRKALDKNYAELMGCDEQECCVNERWFYMQWEWELREFDVKVWPFV